MSITNPNRDGVIAIDLNTGEHIYWDRSCIQVNCCVHESCNSRPMEQLEEVSRSNERTATCHVCKGALKPQWMLPSEFKPKPANPHFL